MKGKILNDVVEIGLRSVRKNYDIHVAA